MIISFPKPFDGFERMGGPHKITFGEFNFDWYRFTPHGAEIRSIVIQSNMNNKKYLKIY
jgi:hypothetical protein